MTINALVLCLIVTLKDLSKIVRGNVGLRCTLLNIQVWRMIIEFPWASSNNKEKLQILSRLYLAKVAIQEGVQMVLSSYVSSSDEMIGCTKINNDGSNIPLNELVSDIEEADLRLIPRIHQAILHDIQRVVCSFKRHIRLRSCSPLHARLC